MTRIYNIIATSDHGYAVIGNSDSDCFACIYFIKTDSLGCVVPGCHLSSTVPGPVPEGHKITAYPNPAQDALTIEVGLNAVPARLYFTLIDAMGRPVHREFADTAFDGKLAHTLTVGHLPRGMYLLHVADTTNGTMKTIKVMLQ
jgi:hypothetical protein